MLKTLVRFSLISAVALTLVVGVSQGGYAEKTPTSKKAIGPIAWTESLSSAQKLAAKEKKIVMVDFGATWCGPCNQMLKTTYLDKSVAARAKQLIPVLIDIDKQKAVADKYKIEAVPTVIFLDGNGKVLVRSLGYVPAADFVKLMDQAKQKAKS